MCVCVECLERASNVEELLYLVLLANSFCPLIILEIRSVSNCIKDLMVT